VVVLSVFILSILFILSKTSSAGVVFFAYSAPPRENETPNAPAEEASVRTDGAARRWI
jgi:hypothetical protein